MAASARGKKKPSWTRILLFLLGIQVICFYMLVVYFLPKQEESNDDFVWSRKTKQSSGIQTLLFGKRRNILNRRRKVQDIELSPNRKVIKLEKEASRAFGRDVKSCQWFRRSSSDSNSTLTMEDQCKHQRLRLVAYNQFKHTRYLCGTKIETNKAIEIVKPCNEVPRLLQSDPTVSGEGMPPIVVTAGFPRKATPFPCSVPCEIVEAGGVSFKRGINGTGWHFTHSMEGEHYYSALQINDKDFQEDRYFATTSFKSEIPLPYFSWDEYNIQQPAVKFDKAIAGASFIARNCESKNHREKLVKELSKYFRVDSLSACLHNAEPPNGLDMSNKKELQRQYLFHLAFENGCVDDYITEKLWGTFESGTLPVYFGAPNVKEHVPPNSIIVVQDFKSMKELGEYLRKVASSKTLYESYHTWRKKELPQSFHSKYDFTKVHSNCRFCRWGYAKKYGFKWNYTTQDVGEGKIPRSASLQTNGQITGIFREAWMHKVNQATISLLPMPSNSWFSRDVDYTIQVGSTGVSRSVFDHDGVTDLVIQQRQPGALDGVILKMETDLSKGRVVDTEKIGRFTRLWMQDESTRFTVWADWEADISSPSSGTLQISWSSSKRLESGFRIRVIVESLDKFHNGGEKVPYYFGNLMGTEFMSPMLMFYVA